MAYDLELAQRIRVIVDERPRVREKEMFGGIAFLLDEKMFVGIVKDELMARVGPDAYEAALEEPHVRPMDFTGKPMKGYVYIAQDGLRGRAALTKWIDLAARFVATLPAAAKRAKKKTPKTKPRAKR